jgi:hypothetical protein
VASVERKFLPVAYRAQTAAIDAERDEIGSRRDRPALSERQIVLGGPALVGLLW